MSDATESEMQRVWEPESFRVGDRVRVRLSAECEVRSFEAAPPPSVDDDELRAMMVRGVDVADRYGTDHWITGHPPALDGARGVVTAVDRTMGYGHFYRVMFFHNVQPGDFIGVDLAAVELERIDH